MKKLVVFDFDKTITIKDSFNDFLIYTFGFNKFAFVMLKNINYIPLYKIGKVENSFIKSKNKKGIPVVCYLHPWEIDSKPPKLNLKGINKMIHYYGIKRCKKKFDKLLGSFEFTTMIDYVNSELIQ